MPSPSPLPSRASVVAMIERGLAQSGLDVTTERGDQTAWTRIFSWCRPAYNACRWEQDRVVVSDVIRSVAVEVFAARRREGQRQTLGRPRPLPRL
jgi:hypothetical protein